MDIAYGEGYDGYEYLCGLHDNHRLDVPAGRYISKILRFLSQLAY
jgi:hypothetical protein